MTQPVQPAPPPGHFPWRAVVSIVETTAAALAAVFAGWHNWHFDPPAVAAVLTALIAHSVNHPAGGSPI